jgi:hypothetical protein
MNMEEYFDKLHKMADSQKNYPPHKNRLAPDTKNKRKRSPK